MEEETNFKMEEDYNMDDYEYVTQQLEIFDKHIEILWNTMNEKYITENNGLLLENLDKSKFFKFMYKNSPLYKCLMEALKKLDYK